MREIKFRCWHDNRMQRVNYIDFAHEKIDLFASDTIKFEEGVLMQYTGLKDKHGNEIYEGDILITSAFEKKYGIVKWNEKDASFKIVNVPSTSIIKSNKFYEVIGNIYENHELLRGTR